MCASCDPETVDSTYPKTYGKLKIAWRTPFKNDQLYGSRSPAIYGDKAIFSNYPAYGAETFLALDADTGQEKWVWNDYISESANNTSGSELPTTYNSSLFITPGNGLISIDMETGKTNWKNNFTSGGVSVLLGNMAIRQARLGASSVCFKLINLEDGTDRNVFTIDTITTPYFSLFTPAVFKETNGDTLLYFTFVEGFQQPDASFVDNSSFYAYNLSTNSIVWKKIGFSAGVIRYQDKLYAQSDKLYCLNPQTGDIIWEQATPANSGGYFHIFEDKLVITSQSSPAFVHAYNLSDGSPAWNIPFSGNTSEPMYYKGLMYFTCSSDGRLWAIKVSNGERIWHERCPDTEENSDSHWSFGINVDPVRNKLYVASFTGAFCLEPAN